MAHPITALLCLFEFCRLRYFSCIRQITWALIWANMHQDCLLTSVCSVLIRTCFYGTLDLKMALIQILVNALQLWHWALYELFSDCILVPWFPSWIVVTFHTQVLQYSVSTDGCSFNQLVWNDIYIFFKPSTITHDCHLKTAVIINDTYCGYIRELVLCVFDGAKSIPSL